MWSSIAQEAMQGSEPTPVVDEQAQQMPEEIVEGLIADWVSDLD